MSEWTRTADRLPPERASVRTMDSGGMERVLRRVGTLWWFPDMSMYVYFTPVAWAPLRTEGLG